MTAKLHFEDLKNPNVTVTVNLTPQLANSTLTVTSGHKDVVLPLLSTEDVDPIPLTHLSWNDIPANVQEWHSAQMLMDHAALSKLLPNAFLVDLAGIALEASQAPITKRGSGPIKQELKVAGQALKNYAAWDAQGDITLPLRADEIRTVAQIVKDLYALGEHLALFRFTPQSLPTSPDLFEELRASLDGLQLAKFIELLKLAVAAGKITPEFAEKFVTWVNS